MRAHFLSTCSPATMDYHLRIRSYARENTLGMFELDTLNGLLRRKRTEALASREYQRREFGRAWAQYVEAMKLEALKLVIAERWAAEHRAEA